MRPRCPACGWTYYGKNALGAAVLIEDSGRLLLVQRKNPPYQGWWHLPAGFVEYGEFAEETAVREALEEVGLHVTLTGLSGFYFGTDDPRTASHLVVYTAQPVGGTLQAADDALAAQLFSPTELPAQIAFQGHRLAVADWLQRQGAGLPAGFAMRLHAFTGAGPGAPVLLYAVIENPAGSTHRILYDAARHVFLTGDPLHAPPPFHYGWVPATYVAADQEPLDVILPAEVACGVGSVLAVRPIGVLFHRAGDHKVLTVPASPDYAHITDLADLPGLRKATEDWFAPKQVVTGWGSAAQARDLVAQAINDYVPRRER